MSKAGLEAAQRHAETLRSFKSPAAAEKYYYARRDDLLRRLERMCADEPDFTADYSVDSLKRIEKWYFALWEKDAFAETDGLKRIGKRILSLWGKDALAATGMTRETLEKCMGVYFGEVVVRNRADARWTVKENAFAPGKYELMVCEGHLYVAVDGIAGGLCSRPGNKSRTYLFRMYNKYFNR